MTCGRDAADKGGGNQQDGCGQSFNWRTAKKYVRANDKAHLPKSLDDVDPNSAPRQKHHILHASSKLMRHSSKPYRIRCSGCNEEVIGPLFSCVNCYSWSCCIECEPFLNEIHDPGHVFTVHFEDFGNSLPQELEVPSQPSRVPSFEYDPRDFEEFAGNSLPQEWEVSSQPSRVTSFEYDPRDFE